MGDPVDNCQLHELADVFALLQHNTIPRLEGAITVS